MSWHPILNPKPKPQEGFDVSSFLVGPSRCEALPACDCESRNPGALIITYTISGAPYYNYRMMGPTTLF